MGSVCIPFYFLILIQTNVVSKDMLSTNIIPLKNEILRFVSLPMPDIEILWAQIFPTIQLARASGPPGPGTHFLMRSILKRTRVYNKGVIRLQMKRIRMRGLPITSVPSSTRFLAISASDLSKKLEETP